MIKEFVSLRTRHVISHTQGNVGLHCVMKFYGKNHPRDHGLPGIFRTLNSFMSMFRNVHQIEIRGIQVHGEAIDLEMILSRKTLLGIG